MNIDKIGIEDVLIQYKCANCNNKCYSTRRPTRCHPKCNKPDWRIKTIQESLTVGIEDWVHSEGEIE